MKVHSLPGEMSMKRDLKHLKVHQTSENTYSDYTQKTWTKC